MTKKTLTSHFEKVTDDSQEVATTVFDLGTAEIKLSTKADLSLIRVTGTYSSSVAREVERIARRCPASIGLEFLEIKDDPKSRRPLTFDTSVLRLLKNLRKRCEKRSETFFLCAPPPKLVDMLKLSGVDEEYQIVDRAGILSGSETQKNRSQKLPPVKDETIQHNQQARKRIYQLNQDLKRTASLEKGLDSAEKCVQKFLPQHPPVAEGYGFAFSYKSSEKVGGDFFDFIPLDDNRLGISIGDVSGHGIDAALVMGISKKLISIRAQDSRFETPSSVLAQVNVDVTKDLNRQTFVTALYGVLDIPSGKFCFARAGHEVPILFYPGQTEISVESKGVALGLGIERYFNSQIEDVTVTLEPSWCLLLCTDGLSECRNQKEAIYSRERLVFELSQSDPRKTPAQILHRLLDTLETFSEGHAQEDDMTAILVQRLGESATTPVRKRSPGPGAGGV